MQFIPYFCKKRSFLVSTTVGLYLLLVPSTVKFERDKFFRNEDKPRTQNIKAMVYTDIEQSKNQLEKKYTWMVAELFKDG